MLVEKGARIVFSSWGSHRDFDNFGRDAHEFIPERWENLHADTLVGFIPFNLGPRACPGREFLSSTAELEIKGAFADGYACRKLRVDGGILCCGPAATNILSN